MQAPPPEHRIIRDRISHEMAFPLGYELLEQAFGDLARWPDCDFWFQARPTYWASDFADTLKTAQPYPIVRVRHRYSGPGFSISVFPVARSLKSIARESFLSSALDAFRQFIIAAPATPNQRDFREALFDPVAHTCKVQGPKK